MPDVFDAIAVEAEKVGWEMSEAMETALRAWLAEHAPAGLPAAVLLGATIYATGIIAGIVLDTIEKPHSANVFMKAAREIAEGYVKAPRAAKLQRRSDG